MTFLILMFKIKKQTTKSDKGKFQIKYEKITLTVMYLPICFFFVANGQVFLIIKLHLSPFDTHSKIKTRNTKTDQNRS